MRREIRSRTATLGGAADLTVVAPVRRGFVPALDAVTYKSRVQRVLRTLHGGRQLAHEHDLARLLSDAVERVGRIQSIRIALIESPDQAAPDQVMLAVTFDGPWESYIRVIWQKVVRSLDLIFCNTEDYVNGWDAGFEAWCAWLRGRQASTPFLYASPYGTAQDLQALHTYEWRARSAADAQDAEQGADAVRVFGAEEVVDVLRNTGQDPRNLGRDEAAGTQDVRRELFAQGMRSLVGLYRLAEAYLPGTGDGAVLHRAATELLREFVAVVQDTSDELNAALLAFARIRHGQALDWLRETPHPPREVPPLPEAPDMAVWPRLQGGIVEPWTGTWHGALLLLQFPDPQALATFLDLVPPTPQAAPGGAQPGERVVRSLAFTVEGLRLAGLDDDEIAQLPEPFVQGMARRAGLLGDLRANHPQRWRWPALNAHQGPQAPDLPADAEAARLHPDSVHLVLQLRLRSVPVGTRPARQEARQALWDHWLGLQARLAAAGAPDLLLSVQWTERQATADGQVREHFGYLDTGAEPVLTQAEAQANPIYPNQIHLGELLVGHANAADPAPQPGSRPPLWRGLLQDGSFLVVRKLRQDVGRFRQLLDAAGDLAGTPAQQAARRDLAAACLLGRWPAGHARAGQPLVPTGPGGANDFDYGDDPAGAQCPLHAHIRLANPRERVTMPGGRPARLVRRSMSYGAAYDEAPQAERGLVFMACVADLGEQFEQVQRWLAGANASGGHAADGDPLLAMAQPGRPRVLRVPAGETAGAQPLRLALDGEAELLADPQPLVRLEWGLYLFMPALPALAWLRGRAAQATAQPARPWSADRGARHIARLQALEAQEGDEAARAAWKAVLEDPEHQADGSTASVWAAIRACHGGVLRTPYGVLLASPALVDGALRDPQRLLTVAGYLPRMQASLGLLYLGLDAQQFEGTYERESVVVNEAILELARSGEDAQAITDAASRQALAAIGRLVDSIREEATRYERPTWSLTFELREVLDEVLADACEAWAGLRAGDGHFRRAGAQPSMPADVACYPGSFMAPSRYIFWPHPGPQVERLGQAHGQAVRAAMLAWLADPATAQRSAPLLDAVRRSPAGAGSLSVQARTLAGVLMGMLPTIDGSLRRVLADWMSEGTLWRLRARWARAEAEGNDEARAAVLADVRASLARDLQLRTTPDLVWRTAARGHMVGDGAHAVAVAPGEIVVGSLASAAQACFEQGEATLAWGFGGARTEAASGAHACPGRGAALALMAGVAHALVTCPLPLRPGAGGLSLLLEGRTGVSPQPQEARTPAEGQPIGGPVPFKTGLTGWREAAAPRGRVIVAGDSWVSATVVPLPRRSGSLATGLAALGMAVDQGASDGLPEPFGKVGRPLADLAGDAMVQRLKRYLVRPANARASALLLSGGGNDLVNGPNGSKDPPTTALYGILREPSPGALVNVPALDAFLAGIAGHYRRLFDALVPLVDGRFPILVHGYDHPWPDGREAIGRIGPWLLPVFAAAGYAPGPADPHNRAVMHHLIERLNETLATVAAAYPGRVVHVRLTGTLAALMASNGSDDHRSVWHNELHPVDAAAPALARRVLEAAGLEVPLLPD